MLVSIVVPCYNSESTIEKLADLTKEAFDKLDGYEYEMILVNDYSRDRTWDAILRITDRYPNVKGLNLARNFGQHAAVFAGLHYADGELVMAMDDDLQNHPDQIGLFLEKQKEGFDVVFGVFRERHFSAWKNVTGAVSRSLLFRLIDRPRDIQMSSFWLARRYVIDEILTYTGNEVFIQLLFFRTTHHMANITIDHFDREEGNSNYTFRKGLRHFMTVINFSDVPLKLAVYIGVFFCVCGLLALLGILIFRLTHPAAQTGWPVLLGVMLFLAGILFMLVGILGIYLGKVMFTVNKSPSYVIRDAVVHGQKDRAGEKKEKAGSRV